MTRKPFSLLLCIPLAVLLLSSAPLQAAKEKDTARSKGALFRYKNEQGSLVTSHILPPEMAYKGYQIVTASGDVLQTVAPAPTEAEKQRILQAIDQDKYDKSLLLRYGTLADLMKAQKRKREEIEAKLSVLTVNQTNIKSQIESEQSRAATYERQGKKVPEEVLGSLEALWGNLEKTEDQLGVINNELKEEEARFARELNRYKQLKGLK